jgi:hypothetical protein
VNITLRNICTAMQTPGPNSSMAVIVYDK